MLLSNFRNAITSSYPNLKDMVGTSRSNVNSCMTSEGVASPYAKANGWSVIVGGGIQNQHLMIIT